jgi:Gly-Xaa carboxypeptidase
MADTRVYWDLSPSIFRYNHQNMGDTVMGLHGIHTVNECQYRFDPTTLSSLLLMHQRSYVGLDMEISAFLEMIEFFVTLILNSDESTQL